jgi:hypothetical protein
VWLNLDIDIIDIGETALWCFKPAALTIRRLKLEREWGASSKGEAFYHSEQDELQDFEHVEEIHIVCADGLYAWGDIFEGHYWPCGEENVFLIDPEDGQSYRGKEGQDRIDELFEARERLYEQR